MLRSPFEHPAFEHSTLVKHFLPRLKGSRLASGGLTPLRDDSLLKARLPLLIDMGHTREFGLSVIGLGDEFTNSDLRLGLAAQGGARPFIIITGTLELDLKLQNALLLHRGRFGTGGEL